MTQEVIFKVGALLKESKYRSSAQYFSAAKQWHREAEWTDALDLAVQQAVRSTRTTRGSLVRSRLSAWERSLHVASLQCLGRSTPFASPASWMVLTEDGQFDRAPKLHT